MLGPKDEMQKKNVWKFTIKKREKVKRCINQSRKEVQEQFGRKINQDANGNREFFWKEVSETNDGKVELQKNKGWKLKIVLEETEVRRIWKEYFEDPYNIDTQEHVAVHMCGFDGVRRGKHLGGEPIRRTEIEVRVGKLKNGKATGKNDFTGEIIKGGGDRVVDWIWRLCNLAFENGVVPED